MGMKGRNALQHTEAAQFLMKLKINLKSKQISQSTFRQHLQILFEEITNLSINNLTVTLLWKLLTCRNLIPRMADVAKT